MPNHIEDLILLFEQCFAEDYNTRLMGGAAEPLYCPAQGASAARIAFTRDYVASALHEVAHWCVAGPQRLELVDYGYWYAPDGRSADQQAEFERVEVKPQALEWVFSEACGLPFRVSADNLQQGLGASECFKERIAAQARAYCTEGLAPRPARFVAALAAHFGVADPLNPQRYRRDRLDQPHF